MNIPNQKVSGMKYDEQVMKKAEELGEALEKSKEDPVEFYDALIKSNEMIRNSIKLDYGAICSTNNNTC